MSHENSAPMVPAWWPPSASAGGGAAPEGKARAAGWFSRRTAILAGFVVCYCTLAVVSYTQRSATYDEPLHLAAGYAALTKNDHRMDPTHPPLVRMWAALPLLLLEDVTINTGRMDGLGQDDWSLQQNTYAHEFLYRLNDADHLVTLARAMIVLLGAGLGILVFCWAEELLGFGPAVFALGFYLLEPNMAAHASLITTDMGVSAFYFGTLYFLWRTCRDFTAGNVTGLAAGFAMAILAKFSAVLLIPTAAVLLFLASRGAGAMTWRRAGIVVGVLAATTWIAIWAVYGFRYAPSDIPGSLLHTWDDSVVNQHLPVIAPLLNRLEPLHLLPNAFTQGFLTCFAGSENLSSYLLGEVSETGWWYYYPVAFLVKTPSVLLFLLAAGLGVIAWRRGRLEHGFTAFVLLPPAIYLGVAMGTGINIGVRHLLPVYPFVLLVAAVAVRAVLDAGWRGRTQALVLGPLLGFWVTMFAWRYPHTLSHFNVLVGGPRYGLEYLADSNLDWGQNLKRLKTWMDRHEVKQINFAYFGMADPAYHGIRCRLLPGACDFLSASVTQPELPGYVAISATVQSGVYLEPEWRLFYEGFEDLEPVAVIGNALKVYRVEHWPEARVKAEADPPTDSEIEQRGGLGEKLYRLGWYEYAAPHIRRYLQYRPENSRAYAGLGVVLQGTGKEDEAVRAFRRAVDLDPGFTEPRTQLAVLLLKLGDVRGAVEQARVLVQLQPADPRAGEILGIALARDGQLEAAGQAFERALQSAPGDPALTRRLAELRQHRPPGGPGRTKP